MVRSEVWLSILYIYRRASERLHFLATWNKEALEMFGLSAAECLGDQRRAVAGPYKKYSRYKPGNPLSERLNGGTVWKLRLYLE